MYNHSQPAVCIKTIAMNWPKYKITGRLFKRAISHNYNPVTLEYVRAPVTQAASKKVTNMVGTFLTEDSSIAMVSKFQPLKRHQKR